MLVQALPGASRSSLALLAESGLAAPFYLAGGTAVALHLGHRISVDLDFFGPDSFDAHELARQLAEVGPFRLDRLVTDTLLGELAGVKISFFRYRYPLISETVRALGVAVAGLPDIAAMKIDAVSTRGVKRDFVDLYFIAQAGISLSEALGYYRRKYAGLNLNLVHVAKSLAYFADAEDNPLSPMLVPFDWDKAKNFFQEQATTLLREL